MSDTFQSVKEVIAEELEVDIDQITMESVIVASPALFLVTFELIPSLAGLKSLARAAYTKGHGSPAATQAPPCS